METEQALDKRKKPVPLLAPLRMLRKDPWRWWMFVLINLVGGTIGVWSGLIGALVSDEFSLTQRLRSMMSAGGLYTFAIAFVVSTAVSLRQSKTAEALERTVRMKSTATIVALLVVAFAAITSGMQSVLLAQEKAIAGSADVTQIVTVAVACLVALYCALVSTYEEEYDDYALGTAASLRELDAKAKAVSDDGSGLKL